MVKKSDREKTDKILKELKRRKVGDIVDVEEEKVKILVFALYSGGKEYVFSISCDNVTEVLPVGSITPVPGAPDLIPGIINVRGDIESVLLIHSMLDLKSEGVLPQAKVVITVDKKVGGEIHTGILIDKMVDVVDVPKSAVQPALETLKDNIKEIVSGTINYNNKNIVLLNINKIYSKVVL